ncbi:MAG: HAD family hydrolase [Cellulomonas sp.]
MPTSPRGSPAPTPSPVWLPWCRTLRSRSCPTGNQEQQEKKISRTGLAPYIDVVLTSELVGVAKPSPRAFELACQRLGVRPSETAYVGDRLDIDAIDAIDAGAAGLRGIWLNRTGAEVPAGVEAIGNLADLGNLLKAT